MIKGGIDLISREAAIDELREELDLEAECKFGKISTADAFAIAIRRVKKLPAMDAVPVRQGKWIYREDDLTYWWECSICSDCESKKSQYCPNCGARMDEEVRL